MNLLAHTVGADVYVVAIATLNNITPDGLCVWRLIVGIIGCYPQIDSRKSATLPMFHARTACNTVSSLAGTGKKTIMAYLEAPSH